jgi:7,8-dihydro-6-hydroxymethylpterin-pyrophosphokinase
LKEIKNEQINHIACLILGFNFKTEINIPLAIRLFKKIICIEGISSAYETEPVGALELWDPIILIKQY